MCLQTSLVKSWNDWNWNGDEIVQAPIIPASRPIPGAKSKVRYKIDVREYLTTSDNAVVGERLGGIISKLAPEGQALFRSHSPGSFDFRVDAVVASFADLNYLRKANAAKRCPDAWLYPDETLAQGGGDCEDLAFLLAALIIASGVSSYCVRVALGSLHITLPNGKAEKHDHCWVMYQNERAVWEILEPMAKIGGRTAKREPAGIASGNVARHLEYVPHYVFNVDHLWQIHSRDLRNRHTNFQDYCEQRRFWKRFDPSFAAGVHNTIYDSALKTKIPSAALSTIKRISLVLDANIFTYDPRDHFDSGYIPEAWARVQQHLGTFANDNTDWESFGRAAHAIGDFYAHSSYLHFAALENPENDLGHAAPYSGPGAGLVASPEYTATPAEPTLPPFDLTSGAFSINSELWNGTKPQAAAQWADTLLSGRYAQKYDPKAGFFENLTSIPSELTSAADYNTRGSLPHHNEIAVDDNSRGSDHKLYQDVDASDRSNRISYLNQFRWRVNTAVAHIQSALAANYHPQP